MCSIVTSIPSDSPQQQPTDIIWNQYSTSIDKDDIKHWSRNSYNKTLPYNINGLKKNDKKTCKHDFVTTCSEFLTKKG